MNLLFKRLFIFLFLFSTFLYSQEIEFLTHNIEGSFYIDKNKEIRGIPHTGRRAFTLELVREMKKELGHPLKFKVLPFKRALQYVVNNKEPYALFNIGKRKSRIGKMKFVGPLQIDEIYFYENIDKPTRIKTINDAKNVKYICTMNGSSHEKVYKKLGFKNLTLNKDYESCFKMLSIKRVDLTVISSNSINEVLNNEEIDASKIRKTDVMLMKVEGQIAFSNMVKDSEIKKWQNALDKIKKSGKYDKLVKKYLLK